MNNIHKLLSALLLSTAIFAHTNNIGEEEQLTPSRGPSPQMPGLLTPQYATSIRVTDFSAGPIVITKPGYYVLSHDVTFNPSCPNATNDDNKPFNAAIIILANCVTLDLNTHTLSQSSQYNSTDFKLIQLGGTNILDPTNTTVFEPKHITIKNGCLNGSHGYGIYGQNNVNVHVYDLMICDCQTAAIWLSNLKCSSISNTCIAGSTANTGNAYGIFLRDNSTTALDWTSDSLGTSGPEAVTLKNIKVCNVCTDSTLDPGTQASALLQCVLAKLSISEFTTVANNPNITSSIVPFAQNVITAYNNFITALNTAIASPVPATINDALTAKTLLVIEIDILITELCNLQCPTSEDECLKQLAQKLKACIESICYFLNNALTLVNSSHDFINGVATSVGWRSYAIRITNGTNIALENISVSGTCVNTATTDVMRATGIALDACKGCTLYDCHVTASSVNIGQAIGYSIATNSNGNFLTHCISSNNTSKGESYGFWLCTAHCQKFIDCHASNHTGVTATKGFYFERSNSNHVESCCSYCHSNTPTAATAAQAIGFDSVGGSCNSFVNSQAYSMTADTAFVNTSYQADLLAVGFRLRSYPDTVGTVATPETNSIIINSNARCNEGSSGRSVGILLDGASCATIKHNTLATSSSILSNGTVAGNGYGLQDTATDTSALIVENVAYANQTANYKVNYSLENEQLPLVTSTYGDMTAVYVASPWANVSLHPNPGTTGCNPECTNIPEF